MTKRSTNGVNFKASMIGVGLFATIAVPLLLVVQAGTQGIVVQIEDSSLVIADESAAGGSAIVFGQTATPPSTGGLVNSVEEVAYDMFGPARGIPESQWTGGAMIPPRNGDNNDWYRPWPNHESEVLRPAGGVQYKWGFGGWASKWNVPGREKAVFLRCETVPPKEGYGTKTGYKLQMRGLKTYQRINGQWSKLQDSSNGGVQGSWYSLEQFLQDDVTRGLNSSSRYKIEPAAEGGGIWEIEYPNENEIFHFWTGGGKRAEFSSNYNPARDTFFVTGQMRVVNVPGSNADLDAVRLLGHCGMDYYLNETSTIKRDYPGRPAPSSGKSRMKYVSKDWEAFNWYPTPSPAPLKQGEARSWQQLHQYIFDNPPPIEQ